MILFGRKVDLTAMLVSAILGLTSSYNWASPDTEISANGIVNQLDTLDLCVDPDWEPYEWIDANGQFHGIAADLITQIASNARINVNIISTENWTQSIAFAKQGHCDALAFLNQTPERSEWLDFTDIYFTDPNVFIAKQEFEYIRNLEALDGIRVALPKGTSVEQHLKRHYPHLTIQTYDTELAVLKAVQKNNADIAIRSLSAAAYLLRKNGLFDLTIAGNLSDFSNEFRIGVRNGNEAMVERLNEGIAKLTPNDIRSAINRYVYIRFYTGTDYTLLFTVVIFFVLIIGLISSWLLNLKRLNVQLKVNQIAIRNSRDKLQKSLDDEHLTNMRQHQFLRMVAHEFRTPLSVIESSCDLLELQTDHDPWLAPTIEKQRLAARYLSDLVDRSLAEDRMVKTYWQRNAAWVSCEELIQTAESYATLLNQDKHHIIASNRANRVSGDAELLQIMLNNLVENALKYSPKGGEVKIEAFERSSEVIFSVTDKGIGIADSELPFIFGKYQRGPHKDTPGFGLGLYLVKGIAKLHNGHVRVESTPNHGSRFTVTLPVSTHKKTPSDNRLQL